MLTRLFLLLLILTATKHRATTAAAGVGPAVAALARTLSALPGEDDDGSHRCIVVSLVNATRDSSTHVVEQRVEVGGLEEEAALRLQAWLKSHARCVVAVVQGGKDILVAMELVKAVTRKMIVVMGNVEKEALVKVPLINMRIVWLKDVSSCQMHVSVRCPTVSKTTWPVQKNVNLWRGQTGSFLITSPGIINCKNPMFGQHLKMLHYGVASQIIFSPKTGQPMGGRLFKLFGLLSQVFQFSSEAMFAPLAKYVASNDSWTGGVSGMLADGTGFASNSFWLSEIDLSNSVPFGIEHQVFLSRRPIPVDTYNNLLKPFSFYVWNCSIVAMSVLGLMMLLAYSTYSLNINLEHLVRKESSKINFVLYCLVKITEPDPLPWFPRWSAGKMLVLLWTILSLFLTMFYTCNLRAVMTNKDLEKPIDTLQDIVDNGQRVYIYESSHIFNKQILTARGQAGSVHYKIADLAERTGGFYNHSNGKSEGAFPAEMGKDIAENRATVLLTRASLSFLYLIDKEYLGRQRLHAGKENVLSLYECMGMRKYSPAVPYMDITIRRATEAGLTDKYLMDFAPLEQTTDLAEPVRPAEAMTLETFHLAFMVYAGGFLATVITFLVEKTRD